MEIKKYAAIDIGSNGIRLLIQNIFLKKGKKPIFKKASLIRLPIRLGIDSFGDGVISNENIDRLADAMKAFILIMKINDVEKYRACATSAMREANNSTAVINTIYKNTGVNIELIDGKTEAAIIAATDLYEILEKQQNYLYVDVGGGSSEFTFFSNGAKKISKSFQLGSVRSFTSKIENKKTSKEIKKWIKERIKQFPDCTIIGSGGNINKVYKISGLKPGKPLEYCYLQKQYAKIKALTYEQRMNEMGLRPDRADVIIPALKIYLSAMKWSRADKIIVPQIGLADGIIKTLYNNQL